MTIASLRQLSVTRNSNVDFGGISILGSGLVNTADNSFREIGGQLAEYLVEMSYPTAGGTADALTLTPTTALAALASNQVYTGKAASTNATTTPTLAVSGLAAKVIRKIVGGTDVAVAIGDIQAGGRYAFVYDTAANAAGGAWILLNPSQSTTGVGIFGTIELGNASDTTLSRSAAGKLAVEGVDVVLLSGAQTLTGKTLTNPIADKLTFSPTTGGIVGTTTNDDVTAGDVGEYVSATLAAGSAVNAVNNTAVNITSISLTAGDWDVWGNIVLGTGPAATITLAVGWISTTSASSPAALTNSGAEFRSIQTQGNTLTSVWPVGQMRLSLSGTTTVYLSFLCTITGTPNAYGFIAARRVR